MSGKYEDIISLPHPTSARHPRMPAASRAAQFSAFAALAGYGDAVLETARFTECKRELSEDAKALLDQKQRILSEHLPEQPEICVTWFQPDAKKSGGRYRTVTARLQKIDLCARTMVLADGTAIPLDEMADLTSSLFV